MLQFKDKVAGVTATYENGKWRYFGMPFDPAEISRPSLRVVIQGLRAGNIVAVRDGIELPPEKAIDEFKKLL